MEKRKIRSKPIDGFKIGKNRNKDVKIMMGYKKI